MKEPLKIMGEAFHAYKQRPVRGVFVDAIQTSVKVSPADYTSDYKIGEQTISKRRIYDAIVLAGQEARDKKLAKVYLPLGAHTHKIKFRNDPVGQNRISVLLDVISPLDSLKAFEDLKSEYGATLFNLGHLPFHNNTVSEALIQASQHQKHTRISSVFTRKRDGHPRIYVTMAFNDVLFGLRPSTDIDLFDDVDVKPGRVKKDQSFDIDL